jgi:cellulose synthase/poly-beta-1,6-N-acetylglucosamine synthase-like glycosyltransferase
VLQAYIDLKALWSTGQISVFLCYFFLAFMIVYSRRVGGIRYYYLLGTGKIQVYPDQKFSVTTFMTVSVDDDPVLVREGIRRLVRSLRLGTTKWSLFVTVDSADVNPAVGASLADIAVAEGATVVFTTNAHHKRMNLVRMWREARARGMNHELYLFSDGDTILGHQHVVELLARPYSDTRIGGTTTAQRIHNPHTLPEIIADQLEHARLLASMAFTSLHEQVPCMPGRLYMVRASAIDTRMEELESQTIGIGKWRVSCKAGDDRAITEFVLQAGLGTILVPGATVTTVAHPTFKLMLRAWIRWGRSSQAYTIAAWKWLPRQYPIAAYVLWSDIILTLGTVYIVGINWPYQWWSGNQQVVLWQALLMALAGMSLTIGIGQTWHFVKHPRRLLLLPLFALVMTLAQFLRLYSLITWFWIGTWGTRKGADTAGGEVVYNLFFKREVDQ